MITEISPPIKFGKLWRSIVAAARDRGFNGDPFADSVPPLGTMWQEIEIAKILIDVPSDLRRSNEVAASRIARSIVFNSRPRKEGPTR